MIYKPYGEIHSKGESKQGGKYGGPSDYVIGYGDPSLDLMSFLILVEAKKFQGEMKPWQLFAMMAHFQKLRQKKKKNNLWNFH